MRAAHAAEEAKDAGLEHRLEEKLEAKMHQLLACLLYTSPSPRDRQKSRMPSSA